MTQRFIKTAELAKLLNVKSVVLGAYGIFVEDEDDNTR